MADLALFLELRERADRVLVGDVRVGSVQLVEVDPSTRSRRRLPSQASRRCSGRPSRGHWPGPVRARPPLVAITRPSGYGCSASAIRFSLTSGPYESAVSIRLTPSSITRRSSARAASGSSGGPQMPSPVMRIAPKPRRRTCEVAADLERVHTPRIPRRARRRTTGPLAEYVVFRPFRLPAALAPDEGVEEVGLVADAHHVRGLRPIAATGTRAPVWVWPGGVLPVP